MKNTNTKQNSRTITAFKHVLLWAGCVGGTFAIFMYVKDGGILASIIGYLIYIVIKNDIYISQLKDRINKSENGGQGKDLIK